MASARSSSDGWYLRKFSSTASVSEILTQHVTLELECIDRIYCNVYVPRLQSAGCIARFFREHRGATFASSALMAPISRAFVEALVGLTGAPGVPLIRFAKDERKGRVSSTAERFTRLTSSAELDYAGFQDGLPFRQVRHTPRRRMVSLGAFVMAWGEFEVGSDATRDNAPH